MIDWQQITYRLCREAGGQYRVAEVCGVHRQTIAHLSAGTAKEPRLALGLKLLAMYSEYVEPIPGARELAERAKP